MLGGRGRADTEDRRADRDDHARAAEPHWRLRLPGRRRAGARQAAAARAGTLPVLRRRPPDRDQGQGRPRRGRGQDRDQDAATGRGDGPGRPAPAGQFRHRPAQPGPAGGGPVIGRYVSLLAVRAAARGAWRLTRLAVSAALIIAAAPGSLVAAGSVAGAWLRGWPPARLYRAAACCAPMIAVWLALTAADAGSWRHVLAAPYLAWLAMWHDAAAGRYLAAAAVIAPAAIPLGLAAGGLGWSYRIRSMETGTGGLSPGSAVSFDLRQWRHQARAAKARITAPGSVPLTSRNGAVVAGAVIRAIGHRVGLIASVPYPRMRSHQVVIGTTGTGKTTLLLRLWAGFVAVTWRRFAAGSGGRPLLIVLDCKGGADSRQVADRVRRVLRSAGARSTAVWPDEASLSVWDLPADQLVTTLLELIEHGVGGAAYYADVMDAVVSMAIMAPCGPPASSADFLSRLDADWLALAHASDPAARNAMRWSAKQVADVALRFRALFRRLGTGLDGPGSFDDADVWYCILEGTAETAVAEAQAKALVEILAAYAARPGGSGAEILLAVDEFSAVSRRVPIWHLYERARSLGLAVQVSAQSWHGLAERNDDRYRIAATADGGIWLLRTPFPDPISELAGSRRMVDTTRKLLGWWLWRGDGYARAHYTQVVDPDIVRSLDVGQAAYIYRGGVTYVQVKRLVAGLSAIPGRILAPTQGAPQAVAPSRRPLPAAPQLERLPDASQLLDDVFGAEQHRGE